MINMSIPAGVSDRGESVWNFIINAVNRGMRAEETLTILRKEGLGYRHTTYLADFRLAEEVTARDFTADSIGKRRRILDSHYTVAKYPLAGGFRQTVFEIQGTDTRSGEYVTRHVTVAHDQIAIRGDLELDATLTIQGTSPWLDIDKIKPVVCRKYPEEHAS